MGMRALTIFSLLLAVESTAANVDEYFKDSSADRRLMPGYEISREDVVKNMQRRREQLSKMLESTKEQLLEHDAGVNLLENEEHKKLSKRIEILEKKLERM